MIVIARRKPACCLGSKIRSESDRDLLAETSLKPVEGHHAEERASQLLLQIWLRSELLYWSRCAVGQCLKHMPAKRPFRRRSVWDREPYRSRWTCLCLFCGSAALRQCSPPAG